MVVDILVNQNICCIHVYLLNQGSPDLVEWYLDNRGFDINSKIQ